MQRSPNFNVCIAGKNQIAVDALLLLIKSGWKDRLMVCPNKTDDGRSRWQPSLMRFAKELGIPIISLEQAQKIKELVFISLEFDRIVQPSLFQTRRLYNIHFSALPAYKGMYTSALPILHGCVSSGVTLHEIDHGIDTGAIVAQQFFDLPECWTARDLYFAYLHHGIALFRRKFDRLVSPYSAKALDQPAEGATYFSKSVIDYANVSVNLRDTAYGVVKQLRAFSFREYQTPKVDDMYIGNWQILSERSLKKAGTILERSENSLIVATIDFNVRLQRFREWDWFQFKATDTVEGLDPCHIDIADNMGWTPLILAAYTGDPALCRRLLENGANPNKTNTNGTTPLMYAFSGNEDHKCVQTARVLIEFGANPEKTDKFGLTLENYHPSAFHNIAYPISLHTTHSA